MIFHQVQQTVLAQKMALRMLEWPSWEVSWPHQNVPEIQKTLATAQDFNDVTKHVYFLRLQVVGSWLRMKQANVTSARPTKHAPKPHSVFPSHWLNAEGTTTHTTNEGGPHPVKAHNVPTGTKIERLKQAGSTKSACCIRSFFLQ